MDPQTTVTIQPDTRSDETSTAPPTQRQEREDTLSDPLQTLAIRDPLQMSGDGQQEGEQQGEDKKPAERDKEGTADGLKAYEATLGKFLGSKLYGLIAPHLTLEKMSKYADDGFTAALKATPGLLNELDGEIDASAIDKFSKALSEQFATTASEWLKGDGKEFAGKVAKWVDTHPGIVVSVALLAAAGAIAANMEIPELKQKFGITDALSAEIKAKLGKLRELSLQSIEFGLTYQAGIVLAAYTGSYQEEDDQHSHELKTEIKSERDTFGFKGTAKFKGDDLEVWGLDANYKRLLGTLGSSQDSLELGAGVSGGADQATLLSGRLSLQDGSSIDTYGGKYDADSGVFTFTGVRKLLLDGGSSLSLSESTSTDGSQTRGMDYEGGVGDVKGLSTKFSYEETLKRLGADTGYQLDENQKLSLGLSFKRDQLDASLDALWDSEGGSSLSGKIGGRTDDNLMWGGNAKLDLSDPKLKEVGAYFGFRDPDQFQTYLGKYRYLADEDSHRFSLMVEEKLWDIYLRVEQTATLSQAGGSFETKGHGAYFLDDKKDIGLIGGVTARYGDGDNNALIPQVGMQIKGIPLLVGYDIQNKGFNVGITIPFGRKK